MKNKHILFITPLPPPVHGSAMVSQYINDSELIQGEFECDFVNLSTSRRMEEIGKGGIKKLLRFVGSFFTLFYKLLTHRYDLCYLAITCHGVGFLKDAPFVLLCKLFGRKVVIHQHNKGMSGCIERWPYRWLIPYVYKCTRVILLSWYLYQDIAQAVKREQVVICPNGIPETEIGKQNQRSTLEGVKELRTESLVGAVEEVGMLRAASVDLTLNSQQEQREQLAVVTTPLSCRGVGGESATHLLFLSNLIPSKGVYVLLDACKILKERGLDFHCNFVGGESKEMDRRVFEEAVKERGLVGRVLYHGPKYGEEKEHYWQMADVFVQPTYEDCFPLTILEAMQHGLPVVSTDEGAVPDMVVDGKNGFICKRQDAAGLANAIERLLLDEALRNRMGTEGYRMYKEKFTLSCFEHRFAEILRSLNG